MTQPSYAIDVGHPPGALIRIVNPILGLGLRTPLGRSIGKGFMVLNFAGRKTGRQFTLPVSAHVIDNDLYALTGATWKQNFRGGASALVVHGGKTTEMRGELIRDLDVVPDLYLKCVESYGLKRAQIMVGLKFREQRVPTREEFVEAAERLHLGAIKFTPA
jgi:hypothetical protein